MKQETTETPLLIIGATFAGAGLAFSQGGDALLMEAGFSLGPEFAAALRHGERWGDEAASEPARLLRSEMARRDALDELGNVHLPALHPLLALQLQIAGIRCLFGSRIIRLQRAGEVWEARCITPGGIQIIRAQTVVNTTASIWRRETGAAASWELRLADKPIHRSLNAYVYSSSIEELLPASGEISIRRCRFPGEYIAGIPVGTTADWVQARRDAHRAWSNRSSQLRDWTLAYMAKVLDIRVDEGLHEAASGVYSYASAGCPNPLLAMDGGVRIGRLLQEATRGSGI